VTGQTALASLENLARFSTTVEKPYWFFKEKERCLQAGERLQAFGAAKLLCSS